MTTAELHDDAEVLYDEIHAEAVHLAGGLRDLPQRAMVYHHIYSASGGNFTFALIAAHGALWAHWYLVAARFAASVLSLLDVASPHTRKEKCAAFDAYVDSLQDINRRVMIEAYTVFHFTRLRGGHPLVGDTMPRGLLNLIIACHDAADLGETLTMEQNRRLYEDFFGGNRCVLSVRRLRRLLRISIGNSCGTCACVRGFGFPIFALAAV